ncbi:MAG: hypothetical protein WED32_03295 [Patescibacteria group bacterium]
MYYSNIQSSLDSHATPVADGVFTWGFQIPGGRIRFHIRQVDGEWHETGE